MKQRSGRGHGGARKRSHAFTELGVAMLSSVLRSPRAIEVNIEIMRAFVAMRGFALQHAEIEKRMQSLENKYDAQFKTVFDAIRELIRPSTPAKRPIGFRGSTHDK